MNHADQQQNSEIAKIREAFTKHSNEDMVNFGKIHASLDKFIELVEINGQHLSNFSLNINEINAKLDPIIAERNEAQILAKNMREKGENAAFWIRLFLSVTTAIAVTWTAFWWVVTHYKQ